MRKSGNQDEHLFRHLIPLWHVMSQFNSVVSYKSRFCLSYCYVKRLFCSLNSVPPVSEFRLKDGQNAMNR